MRHLVYGILAGLLFAVPVAAQSGSSVGTAASKTSQDQAAKDKTQPANNGQAASAPPAPQAAKDDSMSNYDVNGSNASDAMGASR